MKRLLSLLLAAVMILSLTACTSVPDETIPVTVLTFEESDNPVTFFSASLGENYENIRSITVYGNEDGTAHVEFVSDVKKVCDLEANIFHGITAALNDSGLSELNGQDAWSEGEANGSMYIELSDGSCITAGFGGEIPSAYTDGYASMEDFFNIVTASVPEYVAQPLIQGEVDKTMLSEMTAILSGAGLTNLDTYMISEVARDEFFAYTLGLSSDKGISKAVTCTPMMMTTAYSLSIVSVEGDIDAVQADFEANLDCTKWVCVAPSDALIAVKDDMVLCLMADGDLFAQTKTGIETSGWTVTETFSNPN